jgi:hypothetical protein
MFSPTIARSSRRVASIAAFAARSFSSKIPKPGPPDFEYSPLFQSNIFDHVKEYKQVLPAEAVSTTTINGEEFLSVSGDSLRTLSRTAFADVAHLLRPGHLQQVRNILDDPEASPNDKFVAMELLKNANIASARVLPGCQDTGTAIVVGKRGHRVLTDGNDEEYLSGGAYDAYTELNLRYSQVCVIVGIVVWLPCLADCFFSLVHLSLPGGTDGHVYGKEHWL